MSTLLFIQTEYNDFLSYSFSVHLCEEETRQNKTKEEENMKKFLQKTSHEIISYFIGFSIYIFVQECSFTLSFWLHQLTTKSLCNVFISFFTCISHTRLLRIR